MRGLPFTILPASRPSSRPGSPPPDDSSEDFDIPNRRPYSYTDTTPGLLLPPHQSPASSSRSLTPLPSRSATPAPSRPTTPTFGSGFGSVYASTEDETEDDGPLLPRRPRPTWWTSARPRSRRKRDPLYGIHGWRRIAMTIVRHPLFPTQISSILLALLLFALFALALTLLLMHILNPDKYQLPWRSYCSLAPAFPPKPSSSLHAPALEQLPPAGIFVGVMSMDSAFERRQLIRSTWASHPRSRGGASPEHGVNNTSRTVVRFILGQPRKDWERRIRLEQQAYNDLVVLPIKENMNNGKTHAYFTWAHSNALVPPPVPLVIPEPEHDNHTIPLHSSGLVPPWYHLYESEGDSKIRRGPAPTKLAAHDPTPVPAVVPQQPVVKAESAFSSKFPRHLTSPNLFPHSHDHDHFAPSTQWVRPDFVIKADDDSFVMLAELEARLRWELYEAKRDAELEAGVGKGKQNSSTSRGSSTEGNTARSDTETETESASETGGPTTEAEPSSTLDFRKREYPEGIVLNRRDWSDSKGKVTMEGPLIYWGYLVKSRFMAGELYALSAPLVEYVATYPALKSMTSGAEDKQVAAWMKAHPQAASVRWRSERCWVYDHPKAGTVYSHGFLFPSEAARVKYQTTHGLTPSEIIHLPTSYLVDDPVMSHSTVSRFGSRYTVPGGFTNFTVPMEVEALVEGSPLSRLGTMSPPPSQQNPTVPVSQPTGAAIAQDSPTSPTEPRWSDALTAYAAREGHATRYAGQSIGGTVVVHYIKRNEWFLEAALALLGDEDASGTVGLR